MKLLVLDNDGEGVGVDIALRADAAAHNVRYWTPPKSGPFGKGMLHIVEEWEPSMEWAELVILTGSAKYEGLLAPYFGKGYPIFGTNAKAAELELDRAVGQRVLEENGISVVPYYAVDSLDDAIKLVAKTKRAYAIKPWGGESNKAMTCVARDADEAMFMLHKWKEDGLTGKLMLQEKIEGIEMGISGFFGPAGWNAQLEESFEHKKLMDGELGCTTGEQGTVIRHVKKSKLFDQVLEPMTEYLHQINYVGDCNVNCIIDEEGVPWPLEFTMRLGWPDFCIRQSVIIGDPVEWMASLVQGEDTLGCTPDIAVGVLLTHGDYPSHEGSEDTWSGVPIRLPGRRIKDISLQQMQEGEYQAVEGKKKGPLSAGRCLMVVNGTGETVAEAAERAYDIAWQVSMPSNLMFRTDIGERLKKDLPRLRRLGYATGMMY